MDADGSDEEGGGGEEEEEYGSEGGYSDDDDQSWKVRRAAARVLAAAAAAYPDSLPAIYRRVAPELVGRFREREESVKLDVFAAYGELLRQVAATAARYSGDGAASPMALLTADVPAVVRATARQLAGRSPKARAGALGALRELAAVAPEAAAAQAGAIVPGVVAALREKGAAGSGLKIEALALLRAALAGAPAAAYAPHLPKLAPAVFECVGERYYKVAAESLRVCERLVAAMRPAPPAPLAPELAPLLPPMAAALQARLAAPDQDMEVKEAAIAAVAAVVAHLADALPPADVQQARARARSSLIGLTFSSPQRAPSPARSALLPIPSFSKTTNP